MEGCTTPISHQSGTQADGNSHVDAMEPHGCADARLPIGVRTGNERDAGDRRSSCVGAA